MESGAGKAAGFEDEAYKAKGATIADRAAVIAAADVLFTVKVPTAAELPGLKQGALIMGHCEPLVQAAASRSLAEATGVSLISMELFPASRGPRRWTRSRRQANIGGYKAVIMAAEHCPKIFPMMMTAAGTMPARQGFYHRRRRGGLAGHRHRQAAWAPWSAPMTCGRPSRSRCRASAPSSSNFPWIPPTPRTRAATPRSSPPSSSSKQRELMAKVVVESRRGDHHRRRPRQAGAQADPRRRRRRDAAGLRDRGSWPPKRGGNCELTEPGKIVDQAMA